MRVDRSSDDLRSLDKDCCSGNGSYTRLSEGNHNSNKQPTEAQSARLVRFLDRFFRISARKSTITIEVRAGCIAWMTMSYIMVVNPVILSKADSSDPRLVEPVMTATAMSAMAGSLFVGLCANAPLGLMPGMGLNAYFTFGICHAFGVTWEEAMSCCFISGLLLTILAGCGVCQAVVKRVLSDHLKKAITVAIGLFQALIGFQVMGFVIASDDTLVTMGEVTPGSYHWEQLYLSLGGLCLISALLVGQQLHGALLFGIWGMAACAWLMKIAMPPAAVLALPRFDSAFMLDFGAWLPGSGKLPCMITGTLVLLFVSLFDIAGVMYGLLGMAKLLENGSVPRSDQIFASAGFSTMVGALLGTSPVIIANESSAGIMEGAKTGLSAVVVAFLFFLSVFITPLLSAIPHVATAVPLVLIGVFMMAPCRGIDWDDLCVAIPSFLTITVVPFTYSIHNGIIAGILMDVFLDKMPKSQKDDNMQPTPRPSLSASPGGKYSATPDANPSSAQLMRRFSSPHASMVFPAGRQKAELARRLLSEISMEDSVPQDEALVGALEAFLARDHV